MSRYAFQSPGSPKLTPKFLYGTALVVLALGMYGASA